MAVKFMVVYDPHFSSDAPRSRQDDFSETMFTKLEHVFQLSMTHGCSDLIFAGDFSHKKTQPTAWTVRMCNVLSRMRAHGVTPWTIIGNHDVYGANVEHIGRTFTGILISSGAINYLTREGFQRDDNEGTTVAFHGYDYQPRLVCADEIDTGAACHTVAFAHGFLCKEQGVFEAEDYLCRDSFLNAGYDALFVGHDHLEYPTLQYGTGGNSMLLARGGSLSRGTKHFYNRLRTPKVHLVTVSVERGIEITPLEVPCLSGDEIFSQHRIEREDIEKNIRKFIGQLKEARLEQGDIYASLRQVCSDPPTLQCCFNYLQEAGFVEA